jgi:AraC-like DNA-binding protein
MRQRQHNLADLYAIETKEFGCREGHPHAQRRAHWHSEIEINFLAQGSVTYIWQNAPVTIPGGSLTVFWGGLPHQVIATGDDSDCYWIYIPLPWFVQWRLPGDLTQSLLNGALVVAPLGSGLAFELATMRRWHEDLQHETPEVRAIVLLELEARMRRLALSNPTVARVDDACAVRKAAGPLGRLESMVRMMAREYKGPVTLEQIAAAAGLHPNYACALFSQATGVSPRTYLNRLRITHAQRLLATTDMKIVDIAFEAGFTSLSRFYDSFSTACHCTPASYRKRCLPPA